MGRDYLLFAGCMGASMKVFESEDVLVKAASAGLGPLLGRGGKAHTLFEHDAGFGRADVVLFSLHPGRARKRAKIAKGFAARPSLARLLLSLQQRPLSLQSILKRVRISRASFRKCMSELISAGLAERTETGCYQLKISPVHPVSNIIALEVKLSKWKRALYQAQRYRAFANASYVVLPASAENTIRKHRNQFRKSHIGVVLVSHDHVARVLWKAKYSSPLSPVMRRLSEERLLHGLVGQNFRVAIKDRNAVAKATR